MPNENIDGFKKAIDALNDLNGVSKKAVVNTNNLAEVFANNKELRNVAGRPSETRNASAPNEMPEL